MNCPKCGGTFNGPYYRRLAHGERLIYECSRCGYRREDLCNDNLARSRDDLMENERVGPGVRSS